MNGNTYIHTYIHSTTHDYCPLFFFINANTTLTNLISIHICMYDPHGVPPLPHGDLHSVPVEAEGDLRSGSIGLPAALEALGCRGLVCGVETAVPYFNPGHHAEPLGLFHRSQARIFIQ